MSIRDSINTSIKNIANDIASMIQSRANNTLSNLTDEGVEYIKELAEIKAGEYANQELSNLIATGLSQYNVFCVNTGEVDDDGNPAFLTIATGSVITENPTAGDEDESQGLIVQNAEDAYGDEEPVPEVDTDDNSGISLTADITGGTSDDTDDTDENTDEDTTTVTQTLSTSGSFDITTANGKIYTITDTLTLDISDYEDGEYNVYVNPVDLTLSIKSHTLTAGSAFPSDAVSGDYLLNTSQVPYDLQEITITTTTDEETEEETTTTTITKGLNEVFAGTLTISSGVYELTLNTYNQNIIDTSATVTGDYLPLSGGTMTGSIVSDMPLDDASSAYNANFVIVNPNYTVTSTVDGTEHQGGGLSIADTDGNQLVQFRAYQSATAGHCASIENRAVIDGTAYTSYLRLYVTDAGLAYAMCPTYTTYTDSSTRICTTAFLKSVLSGSGYGMATYSKSSNGYIKFANGIIIQWGRTTLSINSTTSVTLPTAFSSTNYNVTTTWRSSTNLDDNCNAYDYTTTGFTLYGTNKGANDSYSSVPVAWQAIGY